MCISTPTYQYIFKKSILFLLISFVIICDTFTSQHIETMASVQTSTFLGIDY